MVKPRESPIRAEIPHFLGNILLASICAKTLRFCDRYKCIDHDEEIFVSLLPWFIYAYYIIVECLINVAPSSIFFLMFAY